jgi:hypothetical protein
MSIKETECDSIIMGRWPRNQAHLFSFPKDGDHVDDNKLHAHQNLIGATKCEGERERANQGADGSRKSGAA